MCSVVLRVQGPDLNLDECLAWIPAALLQATWRVGEQHRGRTTAASGFTLLLSDGDDLKVLVLTAIRAVQMIYSGVSALTATGRVEAEVDVGMYLNSDQDVMASIVFGAEDLAMLHSCGLKLKISAYLSSDDKD